MKIAIIGAGITGLTAGYRLAQHGHTVTIFEKENAPGGLAIGYKEKNWKWTLEYFYHHWFTNDDAILSLAKEIGVSVLITRPNTSSYINHEIAQLDSPLTLLMFPKLSLPDRLRMGIVLAFLRFNPFWKPLEKVTAASFLSATMGKRTYRMIWEPLLTGKFQDATPEISLAWFWARIVKRTTSLAYPEGGFLAFTQKLAEKFESLGGKIVYNTTVESIEHTQGRVVLKNKGEFDRVIVTLPASSFVHMAPQLPEIYKNQLTNLKSLGALVLILRLKKEFLPNNIYWLNVCEKNAPLLAIVEHTHFMDKIHYNNETVVYLGNYLPKDHRYFSMSAIELLNEFDPYIKQINPEYQQSLIGIKKYAVAFAQPIIPINYSKQIPPLQTPLEHVYLANMQQVYPWDRGTNYAVELGEKVANIILSQA